MARRSQRSFMKRQKEIKRKQKAQEKMERRQNKKSGTVDSAKEQATGAPEQQK